MDARLERDLEAGNQHRHLSELTYSFLYGFSIHQGLGLRLSLDSAC